MSLPRVSGYDIACSGVMSVSVCIETVPKSVYICVRVVVCLGSVLV